VVHRRHLADLENDGLLRTMHSPKVGKGVGDLNHQGT